MELVQQLVNSPETGMGYHKVDVYLKSGKVIKEQVVFNCSILSLPNSINIADDDIEKLIISSKD